MESEIDEAIKEWRGGRITVKLNRNGVTDEVIEALTRRYAQGGWTVKRSAITEGPQWDPYKVPVLVIE